ncbi:MAG: twin-arginine translocase subunit TatC [Kiritimatiellaeota bacterium]|nr:twin-arginine translocase subunit TatC [Kiritimatiellota bacterium]
MNSSFLDHLEELRKVLLRCVAGFAVALPAGLVAAPRLLRWLFAWCAPEHMTQLHYFKPMEAFMVYLQTGAVVALALAFPWCAWHIWKFVLPACKMNERNAIRFWILFSTFLFAAGAVFCVMAVMPLMMRFAVGFETEMIRPMLGLSSFVSMAGALSLAFGAAFQTPVAVCIAVRFGLVKTATLRKARPYAVFLILILAAVLTPPDIISQIMLAVPMWLLYEAGIWLAGRKTVSSPEDNVSPPAPEPTTSPAPAPDDTMLGFYDEQRDK